MEIIDYNTLQVAYQKASRNSHASGYFDLAVSLAESWVNQKLKHPMMVTVDSAFSITGEFVNTPTDFASPLALYLDKNNRPRVKYAPAGAQCWLAGTQSGDPQFFGVFGTQFKFVPAPSSPVSSTLLYYKKVPTLDGVTNTDNWLILESPTYYLYAVLYEWSMMIQDEPRAATWKERRDEAFQVLKSHGEGMEYGMDPLQMYVEGSGDSQINTDG